MSAGEPDDFSVSEIPAPIRPKRIGAGLRATIATILAFAVFALSNALSMRVFIRHAFMHHLPGAVADDVRDRITSLSGAALIVAYYENSSPFRKQARRLLSDFSDFAAENPSLSLRVEFVDVNHDLARSAALLKKWPLTPNCILVVGGGRGIVLEEADLTAPSSRDGKIAFFGDVPCADALSSILESPGGGVFHFMHGHGETAASAGTPNSLSPLALILSKAGHKVESASVVSVGPSGQTVRRIEVCDCPTAVFSDAECVELERFLRNGGRMLAVVGPDSAQTLKGFWNLCGITPVPGDTEPGGMPTFPAPLKAVVSGDHPIAHAIEGAELIFPERAEFALGSVLESGVKMPDAPSASILASAVGVPNSRAREHGRSCCFAVEWPDPSGRGSGGRLVVVGDGAWTEETSLRAAPGNARFIRAAAQWLSAP